MAGSISNVYETIVLNWLFNANAAVRPTAWHVGLYTDAAGTSTDQPATEATNVSCPGYSRQAVTFGAASGNTIQNTNTPLFTATNTWATVNYFGVFDAPTGGNLIAWGSIAAKTLANTDQLKFDPAQITVTLD